MTSLLPSSIVRGLRPTVRGTAAIKYIVELGIELVKVQYTVLNEVGIQPSLGCILSRVLPGEHQQFNSNDFVPTFGKEQRMPTRSTAQVENKTFDFIGYGARVLR